MDMYKRLELECKILERYQSLTAEQTNKHDFLMDMEYSKVDLEKLLAENDDDFKTDVAGIICSMNRKLKELQNYNPIAGFDKSERTYHE